MYRLLKRNKEGKSLAAKRQPGRSKKIDESSLKWLEKWLLKNKGLTLEELVKMYKERSGITVCVATMHNALKRIKMNYKKNSLTGRAGNRSD